LGSCRPGSGDLVRHLVDRDRRRKDEGDVLVGADLDAVRISDGEPALRDLGNLLAIALELVLVIRDLALDIVVDAAGALDLEALTQRREQRLLDGRQHLPAALDGHHVTHADQLLLERRDLATGWVLDDQRLADPEGLAIDPERALPGAVLDPVVVADRDHRLAHLVDVCWRGTARVLLLATTEHGRPLSWCNTDVVTDKGKPEGRRRAGVAPTPQSSFGLIQLSNSVGMPTFDANSSSSTSVSKLAATKATTLSCGVPPRAARSAGTWAAGTVRDHSYSVAPGRGLATSGPRSWPDQTRSPAWVSMTI